MNSLIKFCLKCVHQAELFFPSVPCRSSPLPWLCPWWAIVWGPGAWCPAAQGLIKLRRVRAAARGDLALGEPAVSHLLTLECRHDLPDPEIETRDWGLVKDLSIVTVGHGVTMQSVADGAVQGGWRGWRGSGAHWLHVCHHREPYMRPLDDLLWVACQLW